MVKKIVISLVLSAIVNSISYANSISEAESLYFSDYTSFDKLTNDGYFIDGSIVIDQANASNNGDVALNSNHIGFSVNGGYLYALDDRQSIGVSLNYAKLGNITVTKNNQSNDHSFNYLGLSGLYQFQITQQLSINPDIGYGKIFGYENARWMPKAGLSMQFMLANCIGLIFGYEHYFGVSKSQAFTTKRAIPSFDTLSLGLRVYF